MVAINPEKQNKPAYTLIESGEDLERFYRANRNVNWMAFDTEFIPEKYYNNKLCLISVATSRGNYVLDALKLRRLDRFISMVDNPRILKITHAGENDYHILAGGYHAEPKNIFDTQLAYGFLNRDFPLGLQFIIDRELHIRIDKGELKSDWEKRPLTSEQLNYAVGDVVHLYPLMKVLKRKLKARGKLEWAQEENSSWETGDYFNSDSIDIVDLFNGDVMRRLTRQQKVFLIRLHQWRQIEARKRNCPLNFVLKSQFIKSIVKNVSAGKPALLKDRTLPAGVVHQYWPVMDKLYHEEITPIELDIINRIPRDESCDPYLSFAMDMLYQVIKMKAAEQGISPYMVISRKEMSKMKIEKDYYPINLDKGWRRELLGEDLIYWIKQRKPIDIFFQKDTCILKMKEWEEPPGGRKNGFGSKAVRIFSSYFLNWFRGKKIKKNTYEDSKQIQSVVIDS